jgi:hypothetical protein
MKTLTTILLIGLLSSNSFGQTISNKSFHIGGQVLSDYDGFPIENAIIHIRANPSFIEQADKNGIFVIDNLTKGEYKLSIRKHGFHTTDTVIVIEESSIDSLMFTLKATCSFDKERAENDIKISEIKVLLIGGIAPIANSKQDNRFEKKYRVKYYDFGCIADNYDCIEDYNKVIFKYLDSNFGKTWRKTIRNDVIGLRDGQ